MMEYRTLGKTGLRVSRICLGGWQLGGRSFGFIDESIVRDTLFAALDLGINFFDTAPCYGRGRGEELFGKFLPKSDSVVLATKVGLRWGEDMEVQKCLSPQSILWELDESLRRLKRDSIDLYLVHWPDPDTPVEESFRVLEKIRCSGKAKYIGVCNFPASLMEEAMAFCEISLLQSRWNLLEQQFADDVRYCHENQLPFVAHSTLATGLLTGKYNKATRFEDARNRYDMYRGELFIETMEKVDKFSHQAKELGQSLLNYAMNFALGTPGITAAIVGAKDASQITHTVKSLYGSLDSSSLPPMQRKEG